MEQLTIPQVGFHVGVEQDIKSSNPIEQLTNLQVDGWGGTTTSTSTTTTTII
jgi:hypothetical protein